MGTTDNPGDLNHPLQGPSVLVQAILNQRLMTKYYLFTTVHRKVAAVYTPPHITGSQPADYGIISGRLGIE